MVFRTDLAIESKGLEHLRQKTEQKGEKAGRELPGIRTEQELFASGIAVTRIRILDGEGRLLTGKPEGNYITIEVEDLLQEPEERKRTAARCLAKELERLIPYHDRLKVLVIGLGNPLVTPDALGPKTLEQVTVTRHIFMMTGKPQVLRAACVSALAPGVTASTGMETAELIRQAVELVKPDVVLAVDALAARDVKRISTTIQICDTGISPGAGTGNLRKDLTRKRLGVPVVAVGVPTVIDSKTLVFDTLGEFIKEEQEALKKLEQLEEPLTVTVTDIGRVGEDFAEILSRGINIALCPGIYSS